jgi:dTDP-4-dehydrorhamnose 3,5-epimerase
MIMEVTPTLLPGVLILRPDRFPDARGFFSESYNKRRLARAGVDIDFVQDNIAYCRPRLTLRGLHFQKEPFAQAKLVSVVKGTALDVVVDLKRSSPSFGRHFAIELSAAKGNQLFIPVGFAHGFMTLKPDTLFAYKVSNYYSVEHDTGIRFDDALLGIDWGPDPDLIVTSGKDRQLPPFDPKAAYFA